MVSPHLIKKKEGKFNLNLSTKKLFQLIYIKKNKDDKLSGAESRITVSTMVSRLAFFYEKIRNAVDYEDDHLLRKNAIKRIFKRQVVIEGLIKGTESKEMAIHLLTELIQAGYLENDTVPEKKIYEVAEILEKYIKLKYYCFKKENFSFYQVFSRKKKKTRAKQVEKKLSNWIMSLAAAEIEENISQDEVKNEIVSEMFDILKTNIRLPRDLPFERDLDLQIYLGIARNFLNFDQDSLNYTVFKYYNKGWGDLGQSKKDEEIEALSKKIDVLYLTIEKQLKHPLKKQLDKIIKSYSLYFSILKSRST